MSAMISRQMAFQQRPFYGILIVISVICAFWVTAKSYQAIYIQESDDVPSNKLQRVAKVSMLYGETNHMYERALQSHEGERGDLLVHFPGLGEHRWSHMAKWLNIVETTPREWNLPLEETGYLNKTTTYWSQIRSAKESIKSAEKKLKSGEVVSGNTNETVNALRNTLREKSDNMELTQQQTEDLNVLIGI